MDDATEINCSIPKFDLKKFSETLYVQLRYMRAMNVTNPTFVFTLPTEQRDAAEAAIILYFKSVYGGRVTIEGRNPNANIVGFDFPKFTKLPLYFPRVTIVLLDQMDWR